MSEQQENTVEIPEAGSVTTIGNTVSSIAEAAELVAYQDVKEALDKWTIPTVDPSTIYSQPPIPYQSHHFYWTSKNWNATLSSFVMEIEILYIEDPYMTRPSYGKLFTDLPVMFYVLLKAVVRFTEFSFFVNPSFITGVIICTGLLGIGR